MKKFLSVSLFFISILLIAIPHKAISQIIFEPCLFEINNDSSDFSGYPYQDIHIDGVVTLNQAITPISGVVSFNLKFKWTLIGDTSNGGLYIDMIDYQHFHLYGDFGPSLWGLENISDTLYFAVSGVHFELDGSAVYSNYYSDFIFVLNPNIVTGENNKVIQNSSLYPNPAYSVLTIERPGSNETEEVAIYDLTGKVVHKELLRSVKQVVSVSDLPSGIYVAQFGNQTKRFEKR